MNPNAAEDAFWNLVVAAKADFGISPEEQKVLNAHVVRLGLEPAHAKVIQAAAEAQPEPRLHAGGGLESMRALLEVAGADGSISPGELAVARALARHLGIPSTGLQTLVKAALDRSGARRDKAFGKVKVEAAGSAEVAFAAPVDAEPRGGLLRSMPFAARLAPAERVCVRCKHPFADRDSYLRTCKVCLEQRKEAAMPAVLHHETLFVVVFALLVIPVGYLVQKTTGLWNWGWESMDRPSSGSGYRRRRGRAGYLMPAILLTGAITYAIAWGITWLVLRRRRD